MGTKSQIHRIKEDYSRLNENSKLIKRTSGIPSKLGGRKPMFPYAKPSLKIWIHLGIFRDYGLKDIFLGIKLFFFKIES